MMNKEDIILIILACVFSLMFTMFLWEQNDRINKLEIMLQEQQLIDSIGKQLVVSRLNIR